MFTISFAGDLHTDTVAEMVSKDPELGSTFFQGRFMQAFRRGMSNSAGKSAMEAIFLLAGQLAYSKESLLQNEIDCFLMESSDPKERFPVMPVPNEFLQDSPIPETADSRYSTNDFPLILPRSMDVHPFESASNISSSNISGGQSRTSSGKNSKDNLANIVFLSGRQPNWPHIVFVGQVKNGHGDLSEEATSKLIKEMLGPMIRQSLVFGLLMNETQGVLCTMEQDYDNKQIDISFDYYTFLEGRDFNYDEFRLMFLHIISAMKHSQSNIKEIHRGF